MSVQSNYPRQAPIKRSPMVWVDRFVAALLAAFVLIAFVDAIVETRQVRHLVPCVMGLIPCVLLLFPKVGTMLTATLMSMPCCFGSHVYADVEQIPTLSDTMLWDYSSPFLMLIGLYALIRTVQLAFAAKRAANPDG